MAGKRGPATGGGLKLSRPKSTELAALLPTAIWAWMLLARGRYWSTHTGLPFAGAPPGQWPAVAVIVPARDEADLVPQTLSSLLMQDYPGDVRVVLVDDMSTDRTAEVARATGADCATVPLLVVSGGPRPPGWAGKPWAMAQGTEHALSQTPPPEWLLFTDADVWHPPSSLRRLVAAALSDRRDAVSLMARLHTSTKWEKLLLPAFVYFFAQIYPFSWVNDGQRRTAAAAGGCILVRVAALNAAGGPRRWPAVPSTTWPWPRPSNGRGRPSGSASPGGREPLTSGACARTLISLTFGKWSPVAPTRNCVIAPRRWQGQWLACAPLT